MASGGQQAPVAAWIGLGANLGDRVGTIARALEALDDAADTAVVQRSSLYETEPVGPGDQPRYLNAAAELRTRLSPGELLGLLHAIERRAGRVRDHGAPRWGPRTLDLDLLLMGDDARDRIETADLVVPHPRIAERSFVLVPLAEIAAERVHPVHGCTISALARRLGAPAADELQPFEPCRSLRA